MEKGNFRRNWFRGDSSRNNQILYYGFNQPRHMRSKCPLNKKAKKKKKKIMVETWFDSDPSTFDGELDVESRVNLFRTRAIA